MHSFSLVSGLCKLFLVSSNSLLALFDHEFVLLFPLGQFISAHDQFIKSILVVFYFYKRLRINFIVHNKDEQIVGVRFLPVALTDQQRVDKHLAPVLQRMLFAGLDFECCYQTLLTFFNLDQAIDLALYAVFQCVELGFRANRTNELQTKMVL